MAKHKMKKNILTTAEKYERLDRQYSDFTAGSLSIHDAWIGFLMAQDARGNSKATKEFYKRFYIKLTAFVGDPKAVSIEFLEKDGTQVFFEKSLGDVNRQTINSYLRGYRSFGNWCEEQGYLKYFYCPIKEVDPPAKQVYSDKELSKLLIKPDIRCYPEYRNWVIINLILGTGARENTILNIKIGDVDLEEGYIIFNTTKAHKVVRIGLERKLNAILKEFVAYWRMGGDISEDDYLFANEYDEPMTRSGLCSAIRHYNQRRGVSKTSIHLLRHTFAKNWITSGGDIITLAKVLTHSELEMVKRYSNLYESDVKGAIEEHSTLSKLRTKSGETLSTKKKREE